MHLYVKVITFDDIMINYFVIRSNNFFQNKINKGWILSNNNLISMITKEDKRTKYLVSNNHKYKKYIPFSIGRIKYCHY